jgi:hypothetical protein
LNVQFYLCWPSFFWTENRYLLHVHPYSHNYSVIVQKVNRECATFTVKIIRVEMIRTFFIQIINLEMYNYKNDNIKNNSKNMTALIIIKNYNIKMIPQMTTKSYYCSSFLFQTEV